PAVATDSSGVPSAIEKSPLDFADEAEASDRETAAPEMPPPEEVPLATVPGSGQAVEDVVAGPPTPSMSSQGVTIAEDPGSKNVSSPIEVLSPGSVYRPEWGVTNGSLLDTPEACQDWGQMLLGMPRDRAVYLAVIALAYHVLCVSVHSWPEAGYLLSGTSLIPSSMLDLPPLSPLPLLFLLWI
nr:hypothetical protein [Tanacetum cinerariifolium]